MAQPKKPKAKKHLLELIKTFTGLTDEQVRMDKGVCGSAACIAGWHYEMTVSEKQKEKEYKSSIDMITKYHYYLSPADRKLDLASFKKTNPETEYVAWGYVYTKASVDLELSEEDTIALFVPPGYRVEERGRAPDIRTRALAEMTHLFNGGDVRKDWLERAVPYDQEKLDLEMLKLACSEE